MSKESQARCLNAKVNLRLDSIMNIIEGMGFLDRLVVVLCKFISFVSTALHIGAGATWPGEIALFFRPKIATPLSHDLSEGVILVVGTNGKTTTSLMLKTIFEHVGDMVVHNDTGANLLNGLVSSFIRHTDWLGRVSADVGIFEVDENSLPIVLRFITPQRIVILNLFRDQLDRYGEVDVIVEKWQKAFETLESQDTKYILNADDPGVASLGKSFKGNVHYFGISDPKKYLKTPEHATDSTFCPACGARLTYDGIYFSHLGVWRCEQCGNSRPKPDVVRWPNAMAGLYNQYNTLAAVTTAKSLSIPDAKISNALKEFMPAFGRQEEILVNNRKIKIFLSKNPAGFNASIRTVLEMGAKDILFVLNDRIPDGHDVSWIWDVDFETILKTIHITVSGDRVYDMALRLKYADHKARIEPDLQKALETSGDLYVLATYSAMLEARKILTGKKI